MSKLAWMEGSSRIGAAIVHGTRVGVARASGHLVDFHAVHTQGGSVNVAAASVDGLHVARFALTVMVSLVRMKHALRRIGSSLIVLSLGVAMGSISMRARRRAGHILPVATRARVILSVFALMVIAQGVL